MRPVPPQYVVPFATEKFPPRILSGRGSLRFSDHDLAHALFTTGRAAGDQARYGLASWFEYVHRTSIIRAYIRRQPNGELVRSDLVRMLDRSELVGVSYALGMALTAIFCRLELSVDQLMHIDRYASQYQVIFGAGRKRADLIGPTVKNEWVVAEAKGRSRVAEQKLLTRLEAQKRSVLSVAGQPPWLAVGCVASFPTPQGGLRVDAVDPAEEEKEQESVRYDQIDLDRFLFAYYLPFITAIDAGDPVDDLESHNVEAADFRPIGITLGLLRPIADLTREYIGRDDKSGYADQVREILRGQSSVDSEANFPDGSMVLTRWTGSTQTRDFWTEG